MVRRCQERIRFRVSQTAAMIADAVHSLSDLLTDKNETMMTVKLTNSEEQLLQRFRALTQQRQHDVERIINMYYEEVSP